MNKRYLQSLQLTLMLMDLLVINFIFFLLRSFFHAHYLIGNEVEYKYLEVYFNFAWIVVILFQNPYNKDHLLSFELFSKNTAKAYVYFLLMVAVYLFFFRMIALSRIFVTAVLISMAIGLVLNRFMYLYLYQYFKKQEYFNNKVVIIGYNNLSKQLVSFLEEEGINKEILGYCEEEQNINELSNYPILSNISDTIKICKEYDVTEVYSTIAPEQNKYLYELIKTAEENCIRFKIVPDMNYFFTKNMHVDFLNDMPVISLRREPLEDLGNRVKKRGFDIVFSGLVLIFILSWLIPVIGILIKLQSRGPVFFKQLRSGKNNKEFYCYKFRSMYENDEADHKQAIKNDDRITPVGRFLRRTSLDEFPQFINVFMGEMSIVGPRPHMLRHTEEYSKQIGDYMVRQFLKPGITGWAQANGYRGETLNVYFMKKRVEHDIWYMENWSLFLDIRIVFLTVINTIKGDENAC